MRENLWLPDIVVFNQVGENSNYYMRENIIPATVKSTGEIRLDTPQKYETTCLIEIENFPFDVQTCVIVVGSWSQSAATILMKNLSTNMDSTSYIDNSEWELMSTSCVSKILQYEGSDQQYSEIHYTIVLKRRLAFYNRNLIIPMILISFMAQLGEEQSSYFIFRKIRYQNFFVPIAKWRVFFVFKVVFHAKLFATTIRNINLGRVIQNIETLN